MGSASELMSQLRSRPGAGVSVEVGGGEREGERQGERGRELSVAEKQRKEREQKALASAKQVT